ncbi:uncharacterized protein BJ212DRAFT_1394966, partial [Suillus subaureus]
MLIVPGEKPKVVPKWSRNFETCRSPAFLPTCPSVIESHSPRARFCCLEERARLYL